MTRLARVLRALANRLDPPRAAPVVPITFSSSVTGAVTTTGQLAKLKGGWSCTMCGSFVMWGVPHHCNGFTYTFNGAA